MVRKIVVPSAADIAKKWVDVTPARSTYYEAETPKAADLWESNTKGAKGTYKAAVADPKISERFEGGVTGKAEKFKRKVEKLGVPRYGPGISEAQPDMEAGISDYVGVLAALEVPDRKPRGDPGNYAIVTKIGNALHKKRLAKLGATS